MKQGQPAPSRRSAPVAPPIEWSPVLIALGALVLVALAFGGGGVRYAMANLIVQLTALGIVAAFRDSFFSFWAKAPIALSLLVAASLAVPILHLVPLPEPVWTALPGRELAANAREAVGAMGWSPASLDSGRTFVALSGLIVPVTVVAVGWSVARDQLFLIGWGAACFGLLNLLFGAIQILSPETMTSFYPENPMPGVLFGTFANRNSTGVFLVCALAFATLLPSPSAHPLMMPARIAICVLLVIAIILTRSRTALALAALPLLLAGVKLAFERLVARSETGATGKTGLMYGAGVLAALIALVSLFVLAPGRVGDTLDRFDQDENARAYIWEDALYASERYWPMGAGMGTFDEVFQTDESLENMTLRTAGRAHNDYIEVAIEAGLPGIAMIVAWLILWAWLTWRAKASPQRWVAWTGSVILLAVALQSITDYPLRNQSMLAIAAFALLMLARCGAPDVTKSGAQA